tara:strand:+ start:1121 stop:1333 length:213 start_codon:yes stop_codon:yes gene_type:complete
MSCVLIIPEGGERTWQKLVKLKSMQKRKARKLGKEMANIASGVQKGVATEAHYLVSFIVRSREDRENNIS